MDNNLIPAELIEHKKIKHYTQSLTQNIHHFYLYGVIEDEIEKYCDLLNIIKTANELDTIVIYINSEGGSMRMAIQIINSILASNAKIVTSLDGDAFSAASMIFLAGHEYIVNDNCSFMIHTYTGGMQGKGHELFSQFEYINEHVKKVFAKFYQKILTDEELVKVNHGQDIWMDSEELIRRLDKNCEEKEETIETINTQKKKTAKKKVAKKKVDK